MVATKPLDPVAGEVAALVAEGLFPEREVQNPIWCEDCLSHPASSHSAATVVLICKPQKGPPELVYVCPVCEVTRRRDDRFALIWIERRIGKASWAGGETHYPAS